MTTSGTTAVATKGMVLRHAQARWYDLLAAALTLGRERQLRERLATLARLAPGESVLDVGCGTGSLVLAAKRAVGTAGAVVGVDASPEMLAIARRKAARAGADVTFRDAAAERLPFADATFDAVLSTLMLHHLPGPVRGEAMREAMRVVRPGGRLLVVDFVAPSKRHGLLGRLHRHGGVRPEAIAALLRDAGFRLEEAGAVGVGDLRYVLAVAPRDGEQATTADDAPLAHRSLGPLPTSRWVVPVVGIGVVAVHVAVAQQIATRVLSITGVAAAVVVSVVLGVHLLARHR